MKIILPSIISIIMMDSILMTIILLSSLLMFVLIKTLNSTIMMFNPMMFYDQLSMIMILLTLISTILILLSSSNFKDISLYIIPIFIILVLTFMIYNLLPFYILFELILIPTMMLIMKHGKQPERLQASIYLMMYTIMASLPLLISIISIKNNPSFNLLFISMIKYKIILIMMMAFLVKSPMYLTHLWLPKAHVEAPLEGSMILAAILLKLGGYGLIRFIPLWLQKINKINSLIISISLIGATATSLNCIRQKDLKSLIAYSSVAHMGFVLMSIMAYNYIGLTGAILMMVAHGLSSSALFLLTNDLYLKFHSRNILSFKGLINLSPNITFWWFLFMAVNISAPPTINTISEILIMSSMIFWEKKTMLMLFMVSLSTTTFSMFMFSNISHNKNEMNPSLYSNHKIYLSLFIHLMPLIFMIMKMEVMMM